MRLRSPGINRAAAQNFSLAACACELLTGMPVERAEANEALAAGVPFRAEYATLRRGGVRIEAVFDGGHNREAFRNLAQSVRDAFGRKRKIFVVNFMRIKNTAPSSAGSRRLRTRLWSNASDMSARWSRRGLSRT